MTRNDIPCLEWESAQEPEQKHSVCFRCGWEHSYHPTYEQLEDAHRAHRATLSVDKMNHREFIQDGFRYFCGWSSQTPVGGEVTGWLVYNVERAA